MARNAPPKLGRGLAALLGDAALSPESQGGLTVKAVPPDRIDPNPFQPRTDFDQSELESLADSIRVQGMLQPILVRAHPTEPERFQIVAGERRFRAAMLAELTEVPTLLRDLDDSDAAVVALVENLQRQDLNALEEADGYQRLLSDFGLTHEAVGYAVSKSRSHVSNTLRLLRLPDPIKQDVRSGALSTGHARALLNAPNPEALADLINKRGLSVRQAEGLVARAVGARSTLRQARPERLDIAEIARRATEQIGCRVTITATRSGAGEISVQYQDLYQLEELIMRLTGQHEKIEMATND